MGKKYTIAIFLITLILLFIGIFYSDGVDELKSAIDNLEIKYVLRILLLMFLYWLSESFIVKELAQNLGQKISLYSSIKTYMIGEFFSAITPLSSGGQPMQILYLNNIGIPTGISSSILGVHLFFYTLSRLIIGLVFSLYHFKFFYRSKSVMTYLMIIGFIVNIIFTLFMVLAAYKPSFVKKVVHGTQNFLSKLKLIKLNQKKLQKIETEIENFNVALHNFTGQKISFYFILLIQSFISFIFLYAITHYIFMSFGIKLPSVTLTFASMAIIQMSSGFIPMPGGSVGAEGMFYLIFNSVLKNTSPIFLVVLTWRLVTYYLKILITFPFTIKLKDKTIENKN